jgi:hypothetical protein
VLFSLDAPNRWGWSPVLVFERVQIKALLVSVPDTLCSKYGGLSNVILVSTLEHTRPAGAVTDPDVATAITLKNLADATATSPRRSTPPTLRSSKFSLPQPLLQPPKHHTSQPHLVFKQ